MTKPNPDTPEGKARKIIDQMLIDAGWAIVREGNRVPNTGNFAVEEIETDSGPMDYGLFIDGILVGDVEAKPEGTGVPGILQQDERYSKTYNKGKFDFDGFHIPFIYASNGHLISYRDARSNKNLPREIAKFHTPSALIEFQTRDIAHSIEWLKNNPIDVPGIRPYQMEAIESVENAIMSNKLKLMLAMATGTGKTFTAAEMVYRLLKSGYAKRILILVDRRALAAQTVREFSAFEPEPTQKLDKLYEVYSQKFRRDDLGESGFDPNVLPNEYLTDPKPNHTFVYICTIQRMQINLFGKKGMFSWTGDADYEDDADKIDIPIHAFDVIIADECHRVYTSFEGSKWREVLDYFSAIKIGLTATPAAHTTAYFRDIVYHYPVERGIREGYLVDWDLIRIDSGIRMNGLFLKPGEEVQYIDPTTGEKKYDSLEDERDYKPGSLEKKATAPDSNKKIIKQYAEYARQFEKEHGRFPKTLVFATTDVPHTSHADRLVEWLSNEFSDKGAGFVKKITGTVDRPLQRIREFRNIPEEPGIVVTVDLLSTGIDIPTLEAILFIRPVKSRILFEQMMGRGTRLARDIHKTHFTVLDSVGVVEYFKNATNFPTPVPKKSTKNNKEIIAELNNNKNRDYNIKILNRRFQRIAKNISSKGRETLGTIIPDGDIGKFGSSLETNLENDFTGTMKILLDQQFQYNLEHYPRAKDDFVVALQQEDVVTSDYYPIVVSGKEYKPDDYLTMFKEFVKNEPDTIQALSVLLKRPKDLNTDLLDELRQKLAQRPEHFTVEHLRRAYGNELADIIGMVRSAELDVPLLTTRERVKKAMDSITTGKSFTDEEQKWLELIANHLEFNLLIEKKHFATIPFSDLGGWNKADEVFKGQLETIIIQVNGMMTR